MSVIVPAYNRGSLLISTLDSVRAQTMTDWELVVFDDGSRDDTAEVARTYAESDGRVRVLSGPNGGVAAARNRGFEATDPRSEFVIFLDHDDIWEPELLEVLLASLDEHPEYVSAYGLCRCIDANGDQPPGDDLELRMRERVAFDGRRLVPVPPDQPTTFAGLIYHNWVITAGIHLIRRHVFERVGPFDPSTDPADDWDMNLRVSRQGDIGYVPRHVLSWRKHIDSLSDNSTNWKQAYFRVREKTLTDPDNTPEQTRLARLGYREMYVGSLRSVREHLGQRQLGASARDVAKAADSYLRYLRAAIPMRIGRGRRSTSTAPAG